jgi:hypothetical protein
VGDQYGAFYKSVELRVNHSWRRLIAEHGIADAVDPLCRGWYFTAAVDQAVKRACLDAVFEADGADFNDAMAYAWRKAGGLDIQDDEPGGSKHGFALSVCKMEPVQIKLCFLVSKEIYPAIKFQICRGMNL